MGGLLRALIGIFIGTLVVKVIRIMTVARLDKTERYELRKTAMEMKRCSRCGVYTYESCLNPECTRTI